MDFILRKKWANFFGFETVDENGVRHADPFIIRGNGDLTLTDDGIRFIQWVTKKEYFVPMKDITKVEIGRSHNLKLQWPSKVLKVFYKVEGKILVFGVSVGGKLSLTKGYKDEAVVWKEKIDEMIRC
jgi:hypothetical protein